MKQKIKDFLFKRRFKVLKNKKGFSLMEVLVAVGIISIISAIAVPQFNNNRKQAAQVAGEVSVSNVLKAYNSCVALNSFSNCNSLSALNVTCPDCHSETDGTSKFCAHIEKSIGADTFTACVSIDGNTVSRTYGGTLMDNKKVCHVTKSASGDGTTCAAVTIAINSPLTSCKNDSGCPSDKNSTQTECGFNYECKVPGTNATGKCATNACG